MRWLLFVLVVACGTVQQARACECDDDTRDAATILRGYDTVFVGTVNWIIDDGSCGDTDDTQLLVQVDEVFAGTASRWEIVTLRADCSRSLNDDGSEDVFFFDAGSRTFENQCKPVFTRDDVVATFGESSQAPQEDSPDADCAAPPGTRTDACAAAPPALWLMVVPLHRRRRRRRP
jgi:hypothetical protein